MAAASYATLYAQDKAHYASMKEEEKKTLKSLLDSCKLVKEQIEKAREALAHVEEQLKPFNLCGCCREVPLQRGRFHCAFCIDKMRA
jgi:hypothetical protein